MHSNTVDRLISLAGTLAPEVVCEHSFSVRNRDLRANRVLLSVSIEQCLPDTVNAACESLGMPTAHLRALSKLLGGATFIHFGADYSKEHLLKVYLELLPGESPAPTEPVLQFVGFKWVPGDPKAEVVSLYRRHPSMSLAEIKSRVATLCPLAVRDVATAVVDRIAASNPETTLMYLDVTEPPNPRHSVDLNVYDAGLTIAGVRDVLAALFARFAIPEHYFAPVILHNAAKVITHLSVGAHRNGEPFATFYYGRSQMLVKANEP
jgi:hypothetical protein